MSARRRPGFSLIELLVTAAMLSVFLGGAMLFLISQTKVSQGMFDRTDIQRGGRAASATRPPWRSGGMRRGRPSASIAQCSVAAVAISASRHTS